MKTKSHRYSINKRNFDVSYRIIDTREDNPKDMYFHESDVCEILSPIFDNLKVISILSVKGDIEINDFKYYDIYFKRCLNTLIDLYRNNSDTVIIIRIGTAWDYNKDNNQFKDANDFYLHLIKLINAIESMGFRNIQAINNFENSLAFIYRNRVALPVIMNAIKKNETISTDIELGSNQ